MPERYEKIRDAQKKKGVPDKEAKTMAAKIENALRRKEGKPPAKFHRIRKKRRVRK